MNQVVGQERIHYDLESSGTKKLIGLALNILFNPEEKFLFLMNLMMHFIKSCQEHC